jgi:uncharacterized OB-fold protein
MTEVDPSSPSRFWRNKKSYLGLVGEICPHCEFAIFPPRDLCPNCGPEGQVTLDMLVEAQTLEAAEKAARLALTITTPEFVG